MSEKKISHIVRLTVGKGKTSRPSESEEWVRDYYEMEAVIENPSDLEDMRANMRGLIEEWLSGKTKTVPTPPDPETAYQNLPWTQGEGPRGPYQKVTDNGSDLFRHLKAQLEQNKGRLSLTSHYYWLGTEGNIIFRRAKKK